MRISKKANKYKIVKWKNKLVPIIFGTALSLSPLVTVSTEEDSITAELQSEKTRINALARHAINKSTTSIAANSITIDELNLGSKVPGATYTITHSEITTDGNIIVSIAISKGGKTATASRRIEITGVNAANKKHVDEEKTRIDGLARHTISKAWTSIDANSIAIVELNLGFTWTDLIYGITHSEITTDGDIGVSIAISRNGQTATATRKIEITGVDATNQKLVNDEKTRIDGLARHTINKAQTSVAANSITAEELNLGTNVPGATYTITHSEITTDGDIEVSIAISKNGQTATATRKITIAGVNNANLFNDEKARINALARHTINKATTSIATNSITAEELNLGPKIPGATYTITHSEITTDGDIGVSIAISRNGQTATATRKIEITGVDATNQKLVNDEKTWIDGLARHTINKAQTSITASSISLSELNIATNVPGATYTITHSEITTDGDIGVSIAISKNDQTATATRKIKIAGISAANHKLVNEEKTRIDGLARHTINKAKASVAANSITIAELNLGSKVPGATYTITHSEITTDGDIEVSIAISKNGQTTTATRKITIVGVNDAKKQVNKDIEDVKTAIEAIQGMTKESSTKIDAVTDQDFDEDAFNNLGTGADFIDTKGTILTYSHNGITEDGTLEIEVKITKDGTDKVKEAKFNIAVSIMKKNKKIVSKKSKGLSTGVIVGIVAGSISGIVISGMVGLKLLKRRNK